MNSPPESLAPQDWPEAGAEIGRRAFGPFDGGRLARYAAVSGDDNPLHLDASVAKAVGLAAPPVHGMLILGCFEPALLAWRRDIAIMALSAKFLAPILVGEEVVISGRVVRARRVPRPELVLRLLARGPSQGIAVIAEATALHIATEALP